MKKVTAALLLTLTFTVATAAPRGPVVTYPLKATVMDDLPRVTAYIQQDPLYRGELWAEGPTVETVLRRAFPNLLEYAQAGYILTFRRAAGDGVSFKLADLIGFGAVLALTDGEASPGGRVWMPVTYQRQVLRTRQIGYYLVWPGQPEKPSAWGITQLELTPPN